MYDGWINLAGPAIFSGLVVLAAWTIPHVVRHGKARDSATERTSS